MNILFMRFRCLRFFFSAFLSFSFVFSFLLQHYSVECLCLFSNYFALKFTFSAYCQRWKNTKNDVNPERQQIFCHVSAEIVLLHIYRKHTLNCPNCKMYYCTRMLKQLRWRCRFENFWKIDDLYSRQFHSFCQQIAVEHAYKASRKKKKIGGKYSFYKVEKLRSGQQPSVV